MTEPSGFICLHKPPGLRSFAFLSFLKRRYPGLKVGHAGTLDEFAEGLLIACLGRGGKLIQYCMAMEKQYRASIRFGIETDTLDPLGVVTKTAEAPPAARLTEALEKMEGSCEQLPPEYSALKVGGLRASTRRRAGEEVCLSARKVRISAISVHSYREATLDMNVTLSKGGYVRAFARDLAKTCGSVAHVSKLCRTAIGPFTLDQATGEDDYREDTHLIRPRELQRYMPLECVVLDVEAERTIVQGGELRPQLLDLPDATDFLGVTSAGTLVALVRRQGRSLRYSVIDRVA